MSSLFINPDLAFSINAIDVTKRQSAHNMTLVEGPDQRRQRRPSSVTRHLGNVASAVATFTTAYDDDVDSPDESNAGGNSNASTTFVPTSETLWQTFRYPLDMIPILEP